MDRPRHLVAALLSALTWAAPHASLAAEPSCAGLGIEADEAFGQRWPTLVERLRAELATRQDVDACASVSLRVSAGSILLTVTLPDGRSATRELPRSEDLWPSMQALLLVPERPAPPPLAARASPRPAPPRRATTTISSPPARDEVDEPRPGARRLGVELSLLTGSRVGDGQMSIGAGMLSFLEVYGFLLGFQGRADGYRPLSGGDAETALELAVLGGRRWHFEGAALDVVVGPGVAMKGFVLSQTESAHMSELSPGAPPPPPPPRDDPSSGPVPRLLLGARLGFAPRAIFRTFVGLDAELGPAHRRDDTAVASAGLPRFTLGLSLGATVGTR